MIIQAKRYVEANPAEGVGLPILVTYLAGEVVPCLSELAFAALPMLQGIGTQPNAMAGTHPSRRRQKNRPLPVLKSLVLCAGLANLHLLACFALMQAVENGGQVTLNG